MTSTEETRFLELYRQGKTYRELATALGCALSTAAGWVNDLAAEGKLTKRPPGGGPRKRRTPALPEDPPAPAPAQAPAMDSVPTRKTPAITMVAVPELRELISRFSTLEARVAVLEDGTRTTPALAPAPAPARVEIEQWTVRLSKTLIERIKAEAAAAGKPPSHFLEALVWKALTEWHASPP